MNCTRCPRRRRCSSTPMAPPEELLAGEHGAHHAIACRDGSVCKHLLMSSGLRPPPWSSSSRTTDRDSSSCSWCRCSARAGPRGGHGARPHLRVRRDTAKAAQPARVSRRLRREGLHPQTPSAPTAQRERQGRQARWGSAPYRSRGRER